MSREIWHVICIKDEVRRLVNRKASLSVPYAAGFGNADLDLRIVSWYANCLRKEFVENVTSICASRRLSVAILSDRSHISGITFEP